MGATSLDDFGLQVLYALFQSDLVSVKPCDEDVWEYGQDAFGAGWGGVKKYSDRLDHHYYPVVAMKLGQLTKLGYVSKVPLGDTFVAWRATNDGKRILHEQGMFGNEPIS